MAGSTASRIASIPGEPMDKDLYGLPPEEAKKIKQVPGSLEAVLYALEADHEFLLKGDVFTSRHAGDLHRVQARDRGRSDPHAAASVRVHAVLRRLNLSVEDGKGGGSTGSPPLSRFGTAGN